MTDCLQTVGVQTVCKSYKVTHDRGLTVPTLGRSAFAAPLHVQNGTIVREVSRSGLASPSVGASGAMARFASTYCHHVYIERLTQPSEAHGIMCHGGARNGVLARWDRCLRDVFPSVRALIVDEGAAAFRDKWPEDTHASIRCGCRPAGMHLGVRPSRILASAFLT